MKTAILFLIATVIVSQAVAQTSDEQIQERVALCSAALPDTLVRRISNEFEMLETHFIKEGLLKDNSGKSYHLVFQRIAEENHTDFFPPVKSELLGKYDKTLLQACLFMFLSQNQLTQINDQHLEAANNITKPYGGNITPKAVAERIIQNVSIKDFDLEFFRLTSLWTFYKLTNPASVSINLGLPIASDKSAINDRKKVSTLDIRLNDKDEIFIAGQSYSLQEVPSALIEFMQGDMSAKAVAITASRKASYRMFSDVIDRVRERYVVLKDVMALKEFKVAYTKLNKAQRMQIDEAIPVSIIMKDTE